MRGALILIFPRAFVDGRVSVLRRSRASSSFGVCGALALVLSVLLSGVDICALTRGRGMGHSRRMFLMFCRALPGLCPRVGASSSGLRLRLARLL